jgi:hypothetical protein
MNHKKYLFVCMRIFVALLLISGLSTLFLASACNSTASLSSGSSGTGYATVKYDSQGKEILTTLYDTGDTSIRPGAITIDKQGNTYIVGPTTVKYDNEGRQIWAATNDILASTIAVDAQGNVFITGDKGTIKYNKNGAKQWEENDFGGDVRSLALDNSGNLYITGLGDSQTPVVIKYDTNGKIIWNWAERYTGTQNNILAMTLDKSDNVYVTGSSESSTIKGDFGYQTIKLDAGGNEAWEANYEGPWRDNTAHGITVDGQGNTYVTGDSRSSATGDDFATVKYDSSGHQVWVARYNGPANGEDLALGIGLDAKGNIYVCGPSSRDSISGKRDYATVKYDTDGNQLWATRYSGPETTDDSYPTAFAVDTAGNSYVTGLNLVSLNIMLPSNTTLTATRFGPPVIKIHRIRLTSLTV